MSFASIDGVTLHYRLSGAPNGVPLVCINSLGTNFHIWDEVLPLIGRGRRILTYDKRGHGLSDAPPGPCSIDDHVADLLGLAAQVGFERSDLCGLSIGGMIAMRAAVIAPQSVRRLILSDTAPSIGTAAAWNARISRVEAEGMRAIAEAVLGGWVSPGFRERRPADYAGWLNMLERAPAEGYTASCAAVRDAELAPDARQVTAPTLVIVGEHDASTPPAAARALAAMIAGAQLRQIAGAGHLPVLEQAEAFATLLNEHLSEVVHV
jgi:3-oxoadipate enol-lactonase